MPNTSSTGGYLLPEGGTPTLSPDDAFDAIIQALVVGVVGLPGNLVRPRWQPVALAMPAAGTDWCAIGVTDEDPDAMPYVTHDGSADSGQGADYVQVNDTATILASFYGPSARGNASRLRGGLMIAENREALQLLNMGLVGMPTATRFVPELVNQQTQRRADLSFSVRRANVFQVPVRNLASVQFVAMTDDGKTWPGTVTLP